MLLSNSWSPIKSVTICTVTVVTDSKGLAVSFAASPAAITTIIVSPIALEVAKRMDPIIPGRAAGKITNIIVSYFVAPNPYEPSLRELGTALITSSEREDIKGIIIMPITRPAAKALSEAIDKPKVSPMFLIKGPIVKAAKKPYTTVGIPASISKRGLTIVLVL